VRLFLSKTKTKTGSRYSESGGSRSDDSQSREEVPAFYFSFHRRVANDGRLFFCFPLFYLFKNPTKSKEHLRLGELTRTGFIKVGLSYSCLFLFSNEQIQGRSWLTVAWMIADQLGGSCYCGFNDGSMSGYRTYSSTGLLEGNFSFGKKKKNFFDSEDGTLFFLCGC
jgi:hypothetical protein